MARPGPGGGAVPGAPQHGHEAPGEYQQLVEFLGQQFTAIGNRFSGVDRRLDSLEERVDLRFGEVFGHFDEVYRRLERLDQEYYAITQALRRIEGRAD